MAPSGADRNAAWLTMLGALLLLSAHVAGKAIRDALFLSNFPVSALPQMMIAASVASLVAAWGVSRFLSRVAPARAVPVAMLASGVLLAGEWVLVRRAPRPGSVAVYLHLASLSLVLFSGFWSAVNERFDPYTAKTVVARAGAFGCLGGIVGGLAAMQVAPWLGAAGLLPGLATLHLLAAGLVRALGGPQRREAAAVEEPGGGKRGLRTLLSSPLIARMALLLLVVQVTEQLVDYVFKATAAVGYVDETSRLQFFAAFYTVANLAAFALQSSLGPRALKLLGVGGTLALLPAAMALASATAALFERIATVSIARGLNNVMSTSFFKVGFELLWTPVPAEEKRPAKVYVDVGASGLGDLLGSGLVMLLVSAALGLPHTVLLGLAGASSLVALLLVSQLHRGYVRQLADNLRSGTIQLDSAEIRDATTSRALAESRLTIDRAELMARIQELDAAGQAPSRTAAPSSDAASGQAGPTVERLLEQVGDLVSGDVARARRALDEGRGTLELASFAVPLMARHGLAQAAAGFLRELAPRILGQLGDALLDPDTGVLIRRRVPHAIGGAPGARAIDALLGGLDDEDFEVRLECARAAARMAHTDPALRIDRERALRLVGRELAATERDWEHHGRRRRGMQEAPVLLESADLPVVDRSMELVFTLLAIAFGTEIMGSTLRAVHSADPTLRGTALEYLQTVLPEKLRRQLVARVPGGDTARRTQRQAEELAEALIHSSAALPRRGRD